MALHTYTEFADLAGMSTGNLANMIKRGNVECIEIDGRKRIDDSSERNKAWLAKRKRKLGDKKAASDDEEEPGDNFSATHVVVADKPKTNKKNESPGDKAYRLELDLEEAELKIKQERARYEKVKADKAEGLVIPTELVKGLYLQFSKSIFTESKGFLEDFILQVSTKYSIPTNEAANWRKLAIDGLNMSIKNSVQRTKDQLNNIVDEYSMAKGRGERD